MLRVKKKRKKVFGTSVRPRLSVYRSLKNISAQIIDDTTGRTLVAVSSMEKDLRKIKKKMEAASAVGKLIAQRSIEKGIKKVVFDRGKFLYHGRVKTLADAAREGGLEF